MIEAQVVGYDPQDVEENSYSNRVNWGRFFFVWGGGGGGNHFIFIFGLLIQI